MDQNELEQSVVETNRLIKRLIRSQNVTLAFKVVNFLVIVGVLGGLYLFIKPFIPKPLQGIVDIYEQSNVGGLFAPKAAPEKQSGLENSQRI